MITKRLVYHFYAPEGFETHPVYRIHQYLLKKYNEIFNEALFVIAVDNIDDKEQIKKAKTFLLECDFNNIEFRVEKNDYLYEVSTFDKYILQKLDALDGMTFFAHSKGIKDYHEGEKSIEAIYMWIFSLYYLSLKFYKEGEKMMFATSEDACFFGGLLAKYKEKERIDKHFPKNNAMYIGTFYWMNCKQIYSAHKNEIPYVYNRFYAENFPGSICHPYNFELYSHNYMMVKGEFTENNPIFRSVEETIKYAEVLLTDDEFVEFKEEYNEMKKELNLL